MRTLTALTLTALAALTAAGAAPGSSQLIRHGVGIGKARLGMTEAQVRAALGAPSWVVQTRTGFGGVRRELQFRNADYTVVFRRRGGVFRAVAVTTIVRRERTQEGLGVGTLESRVRNVYGRRMRCAPLRTRQLVRSTVRVVDPNSRTCVLATGGGTETAFESSVKQERPYYSVRPDEWTRARVYIVTVRFAGAS